MIPTQGAVDKMPQLVLVSVSTHEGIDGHYVSYLVSTKAAEHAAEVAKTILVGRDTYDVGALSHEMTNALPPYSNPPALAAADACLWDINAKAADLPLYKYLGTQREKIRAYAVLNSAHRRRTVTAGWRAVPGGIRADQRAPGNHRLG